MEKIKDKNKIIFKNNFPRNFWWTFKELSTMSELLARVVLPRDLNLERVLKEIESRINKTVIQEPSPF